MFEWKAIDFDALEEHVEELLTLLRDRQAGMTAFYPHVIEHLREIERIAAPALHLPRGPRWWLQALRNTRI